MLDLETANSLVAIGTVLLNVGSVALLVIYLRPTTIYRSIVDLIVRWALPFAFLLSLVASVVTLYYSEFLGVTPCGLCWLQRVFLYPQVVLFGIAAWKRDAGVWLYSVGLSILGALVALYQHYLQLGGLDVLPCPATGSAVDCSVRTMFEFGYITYPFMAFSLFVFLILLALVALRTRRV